MHYGKCIFVKEIHSPLDKAKIIYANKFQEGSSAQPFNSLPVLIFQSKVFRRYHRTGHCDFQRRLPVSVLSRRPT